MLSNILERIGSVLSGKASLREMSYGSDSCQPQRTHEEAKRHRKSQKKARADKAARKRNRRK